MNTTNPSPKKGDLGNEHTSGEEIHPSAKKRDPGNSHASGEEIQESIYPNYHEENIMEGDEFLDDAIRTEDQPLGETTLEDGE